MADDKLGSQQLTKLEAIAGTACEYAPYVNFGHRLRNGKFYTANPFLSTAGEIVRQKLIRTITEDQQLQINKDVRHVFNKALKDGVEITRYGDTASSVELGTITSVDKGAAAVVSQAKASCPTGKVNGGNLRNTIMWRSGNNPQGKGYGDAS